MKYMAIILHADDDVATALRELKAGQAVTVTVEAESNTVAHTTELREAIQFGHKYALRDIAKGEAVLKYGLPIGKALEDIPAGTWVHVHNCRSEHFGHRHEKYGIVA